jgi:hypothetical protein
LGNAFVSILQLRVQKGASHWGVLKVPKKFVNRPMNIAFSKNKNRL